MSLLKNLKMSLYGCPFGSSLEVPSMCIGPDVSFVASFTIVFLKKVKDV